MFITLYGTNNTGKTTHAKRLVAKLESLGKKTKYGIKFSGVGHDGQKISKKEYLERTSDFLHKKGFYVEVSDKMAQILLNKYKVPYLDDPQKVKEVINLS